MARKRPVGYVVRRPITLWGRRRDIGEILKPEEVASLARIDSLVRAGRLNEIYDETDKGKTIKGRTGITKPLPKPERKAAAKKSTAKKVVAEEK